jgi:DHA1 family inner membrane transport protein
MFANLVKGCSVLAPAGMLIELPSDLGAAPALASASVSLDTSVLYIGQAVGSGIGGLLYARELLHGIGYAGMAFAVLALATVISTRRLTRAPA